MEQLDLFLKEKEPKKQKSRSVHQSSEFNIFLGPKTLVMGYRKYINSQDWAIKRKFAIEKRGNHCERCGSAKQLEVHHKHYDTLYNERLEDVEVLCKICHVNADTVRERMSAFETWAFKKYGENWWKCDQEYLYEEFEEWLEWKEQEDNDW